MVSEGPVNTSTGRLTPSRIQNSVDLLGKFETSAFPQKRHSRYDDAFTTIGQLIGGKVSKSSQSPSHNPLLEGFSNILRRGRAAFQSAFRLSQSHSSSLLISHALGNALLLTL